MINDDAKSLLLAAADEIRGLRRVNNDMAARIDTLEIVAAIAGFKRGSQGMAEDIAWKIDRFLSGDEDRDGLAYQRQNIPA